MRLIYKFNVWVTVKCINPFSFTLFILTSLSSSLLCVYSYLIFFLLISVLPFANWIRHTRKKNTILIWFLWYTRKRNYRSHLVLNEWMNGLNCVKIVCLWTQEKIWILYFFFFFLLTWHFFFLWIDNVDFCFHFCAMLCHAMPSRLSVGWQV